MVPGSGYTIWKRKFPRINLEMEGDFRILMLEKDQECHSGHIKTLGGGGLMLIAPLLLSEGTPLQVRIFHPAEPIMLNALVVWAKGLGENEGSGFKTGLKFDPNFQAAALQIDFLLHTEKK